jgi:hypothetical protein
MNENKRFRYDFRLALGGPGYAFTAHGQSGTEQPCAAFI